MQNWIWMLIAGIISIIGGLIALFNPFAATLAAEQLAGILFLVTGVIHAWGAIKAEGWGPRIWAILLAILFIVAGLNLLANPLAGILALTLAVGILFAVSGILKIIASFQVRGTPFFWLLLLSGALSIILAIMILTGFPGTAVFTLGVLLAIELLSNGAALVALALAFRKMKNEIGDMTAGTGTTA